MVGSTDLLAQHGFVHGDQILRRHIGHHIVDMQRRLYDFYGQFWQMRRTEPQFAHMDEETALMLTAMLGGGCYCMLRHWIMNDVPKSPAQIAAMMTNVIRWPSQSDFIL